MDNETMERGIRLPASEPYLRLREIERYVVESNESIFARQCAMNNIKYQIHQNDEYWNENILAKESLIFVIPVH